MWYEIVCKNGATDLCEKNKNKRRDGVENVAGMNDF